MSTLLLENGSALLLEDGGELLLSNPAGLSFAKDNIKTYITFDDVGGSNYPVDRISGEAGDAPPTAYATGIRGNAADFESSSPAWVQFADNTPFAPGYFPTHDFSVIVWAKFESLSASQVIVARYMESGGRITWVIWYDHSAGRIKVSLFDDDMGSDVVVAEATASNFGAPSTATWYQIVFTRDRTNSEVRINVNGTAETAASYSGNMNTNDGGTGFKLGVGASLDGGGFGPKYYDGLVDEIVIVDAAVTNADATLLYASGTGIFPPYHTPYLRAPHISGLQAYYKMDEASGNMLDAINGYTAVQTGGVGATVAGVVDGARVFDGTDDQGAVADATQLVFTTGALCLFAWVKCNVASTLKFIAGRHKESTNEQSFALYADASDQWAFRVSDDGNSPTQTVISSVAVSAGRWQFVVAYHDPTGNVLGISLNGGTPVTIAHSTDIYSNGTPTNAFTIGGMGTEFQGSPAWSNSTIGELGVLNRIPTTAEIGEWYNDKWGRTYEVAGGGGGGIVTKAAHHYRLLRAW